VKIRSLTVVAAVVLLLARDSSAQVAASTLTGTIADGSGGALPGATITVVAETTNIARNAVAAFASGKALEVRAEVFNVTNTPPLGPPNGVFGTPAFGSISTAGDPRVVQLAVKGVF
jgi:hypothetical protein